MSDKGNPVGFALAVGALLATPAFVGGLLITENPFLAAVIGLAFGAAPLVALDPTVALVLLVGVEVSQVGGLVHGVAGLTLPTATLLGGIGAIAVGLRRGRVHLTWSPVFLFALLFVAAEAVSVIVAHDPTLALHSVFGFIRDLADLFVVTVLLTATNRFGLAVRICVIILVALALLSIAQETVLGNAQTFGGFSKIASAVSDTATARHTGPLTDANFWARVLVLYIPFALSLCASAWSRSRRVLWFLAFLALVGGVLLTQSRGGVLALGVAVVAWLIIAGRRYARLLVLGPIVAWILIVNPITGPRLETLTQVSEAQQGAGDPSLVGRAHALDVGLAIFGDHPLLGVGAGNYPVVAPAYQRRLGFATIGTLAPHNLYVEIASEAGVLGLAAWLLFVGSTLFVTSRALVVIRRLSPERRAQGTWLAVGVLSGLIGWSTASLFLHLNQFRSFLIVAAIGAALDVSARRGAAELAAVVQAPIAP